jgi:hypothetical protein
MVRNARRASFCRTPANGSRGCRKTENTILKRLKKKPGEDQDAPEENK